MYCNGAVSATTLVGLLCLSVIFMFDPTHDYPTVEKVVELEPGESCFVSVPASSSSFMQWAGSLISDPYLWVSANVAGLELAAYQREVVPGTIIGIPVADSGSNAGSSHSTSPVYPSDSGRTSGFASSAAEGETGVIVANTSNDTVISTLRLTVASSPDSLGSAKTWWYIIVAAAQTLIGGGIAIIRPSAASNAAGNGRSVKSKPGNASAKSAPCPSFTFHCCDPSDSASTSAAATAAPAAATATPAATAGVELSRTRRVTQPYTRLSIA